MRIFFLAAIPLLTAFIGWLMSIKYSESQSFWEKFSFKHEKIKAEIAFSQNSLSEILNGGEKGDGKKDVFSEMAENYLTNSKKIIKPIFLSEDEIRFVEKYLQNLGTTDKDSQLNLLKSMEAEIQKYSMQAETKCKKYRPLFIKLGFLAGLVIFILIV